MEPVRNQDKGGRTTTLLTHFLFILIIFVLPEVIMALAFPQRSASRPIWSFYIKTLIYVGVFYLNYFLIIPSALFTPKRNRNILRLIVLNILVIACALALSYCVTVIFGLHRPMRNPSLLKAMSFIVRDTVMLVLTVGLAVALRLGENLRNVEAKHQEMLAVRRETELESLKSQLNPHFLFNTLNTIYALIAIDGATAQKAVHELSGLLRYTLYEDDGEVELHRETDFIENYASLMCMRLGKRPVNLDIELGSHGLTHVPPLILLPLVENAFKYGNTQDQSEPIDISIIVKEDTLVCRTSNFYSTQSRNEGRKDSGVGLANVRRRLQLLYGSRASLRTSATENKFTTILSIPLK